MLLRDIQEDINIQTQIQSHKIFRKFSFQKHSLCCRVTTLHIAYYAVDQAKRSNCYETDNNYHLLGFIIAYLPFLQGSTI